MSLLEVQPEQIPLDERPPRSLLQRRALGPVIDAMGNVIYDEAAERISRSVYDLDAVTTVPGLERFLRSHDRLLTDVLRLFMKNPKYKEAIDDFQGWLNQFNFIDGAYGNLTNFTEVNRIISEGLTTSIYFPVNVALHALGEEGIATSNRIPVIELIDRMPRKDLIDCTEIAAHTANGFYDVPSGTITGFSDDEESRHDCLKGIVEVDEEGKYEPSTVFKTDIRIFLTHSNRNEWGCRSSGCPVRHHGFAEDMIEEFASEFFVKHPFEMSPPGSPSLIERGMRVTAQMLTRGLRNGHCQ